MVRLKDRDSLEDIKDHLGVAFHDARLASLHVKFFTDAPLPHKEEAAAALENFYQAARKLGAHENEFNRRARPASTPSVMKHLRAPDHFAALRAFNTAKEKILDLSPTVGSGIVRLVEKRLSSITSPHSRAKPVVTPR